MARPTHRLVAKKASGDSPGRSIGVAWENDQGWLSIRLNPCVVISWDDDVYLNLYPIDQSQQSREEEPPPPEDDDIPF